MTVTAETETTTVPTGNDYRVPRRETLEPQSHWLARPSLSSHVVHSNKAPAKRPVSRITFPVGCRYRMFSFNSCPVIARECGAIQPTIDVLIITAACHSHELAALRGGPGPPRLDGSTVTRGGALKAWFMVSVAAAEEASPQSEAMSGD